MNPVAMTLARYKAKEIVKQDWRDMGEKLSQISHRDLIGFANAYLAGNPELIEQAEETVRNSPRLQTLVRRQERWMRRMQQCRK